MWCRHAIVLKSASGQHKFINSKGSENGYLLMGWLFVLTRFLSSFSIIDSGSGSGLILFPSPILPFSDIRRYPSLGLDFPSSTWSFSVYITFKISHSLTVALSRTRAITPSGFICFFLGLVRPVSWPNRSARWTQAEFLPPQWYDYCDWRMSSLQK